MEIAKSRPSIYLDLESGPDRAKLADPEMYLELHADQLVILDEIQRAPELFRVLRGIIDRGRRQGKGLGRFLLLGSASMDLLKQTGESLAGRISYLELTPLDVLDAGEDALLPLWIRGGFPGSFLARSEAASFRWRLDFIRTYLERDVPGFGIRVPAETIRRFWTMLAHSQSCPLNLAQFAALSVTGKSTAHYLDIMIDLLLVRKLPAWSTNSGKRLTKSPKVIVRDSGIVHALLGFGDLDSVLGHPISGHSWEGFVIETLLQAAPERSLATYYRAASGAELDLVIEIPDGHRMAVEIKSCLSPRLEGGFFSAVRDVKPDRSFVVYRGAERYPLGSQVEAISLVELANSLAKGALG